MGIEILTGTGIVFISIGIWLVLKDLERVHERINELRRKLEEK